MESRKYCAYNKTQASFLSLGITVADTVNERIRGQIENLARNAKTGLWLNPCPEFPAGPGLPDFDVVYLDEDLQVVAVAESFPDASFKSPRPLPASALALPSHTIASSQTQCGDELIIWTTDGMGHKAAHSSKLVTQALMRFAPSPADEDAAQPRHLSERKDAAEETESESVEKPSLMNRLKVWSAAKRAHRDGEITLSIAPAITPPVPARPVSVVPAAASPIPVAPAPARWDPPAPAPVTSVQVTPAAATAVPVRPVPVTSAPIASEFVIPTAATLPQARLSQIKPLPVSPAPVRPVPTAPSSATSEMVVPDASIPAPVRLASAAPVLPAAAIPAAVIPPPARQIPINPVMPASAVSAPANPAPFRSASVMPAPPTSEFVIPTPAAPTPLKSTPVKPEATTPVKASPASVLPGTESHFANQPPAPSGFTLSRTVENTSKSTAPFERLNDKEEAEFEVLERPSLKTRYQAWAAEKAALRAADISISIVPVSAAPASAPPSTEFVVPKQPPASAGFIHSRAVDDTAKPPALVERFDGSEDSEPKPPERPSLISRYKIWSAERAARQAADHSLSIAPSPDAPAPALSDPVAPDRIALASIIPTPATPVPVETAPIPQNAVSLVAPPPPPDPAPATSLSALPSSESLFARRPAVERVPTSPLAGRFPAKSSAAVEPVEESRKAEPEPEENPSLTIRFLRWFNNVSTTAQRHSKPGLVAYYWTGGTPKPHEVINISATGLYLHTREHWLPDTVILMTLQKSGGNPDNPDDSVSVLSKVVRQDDEGAGFEFVTSESANVNGGQYLPGRGIDKDALQRFLRRMKS